MIDGEAVTAVDIVVRDVANAGAGPPCRGRLVLGPDAADAGRNAAELAVDFVKRHIEE